MVRIFYILKGVIAFLLLSLFTFSFQSWKSADNDPLLLIDAVVFLGGPYNPGITEMNDNLRAAGLIPNPDPYFGTFNAPPLAFSPNGSNSVVDWVVIRLRDKTNPMNIIAERAALVQRDGNVVEVDGVNPVQFPALPCDDYFIEIEHRNHLSIGSDIPVPICTTPVMVDFTDPAFPKFGLDPVRNVMGKDVMWAGNTNGDDLVRFAGKQTDVNQISEENWFCTGSFGPGTPCLGQYSPADTNMDGNIDYNLPSTDVDVIEDNIMNHPGNGGGSPTFPIIAQLY